MEKAVRNGDREIRYRSAGDTSEETLLFVHGSGADSRLWERQFDSLPDRGYTVVAPDLSGHGASDDLPDGTEPGYETLDTYARDVAAVARETDASVLIGNSLGGAVVLRATAEDIYNPDALVLAGTGAKLGVDADVLGTLRGSLSDAISVANRLSFHDAPDDAVELSERLLYENGQTVLVRDFETCDSFDERDRVGEIGVPALAVVGSEDDLTPVWFHEFLADEIPDCRIRIIDGTGHLAMVERPREFDRALVEFADRI